MREPNTEGVAIQGVPESCVGVREGVGEALTADLADARFALALVERLPECRDALRGLARRR